MPLTAHQIVAIRRRFPEAEIRSSEEFDDIVVTFRNGDSVWGMPGAHSGPGSVLTMPAAGYHAAFGAVASEEAQAAEAMLREFLGCD